MSLFGCSERSDPEVLAPGLLLHREYFSRKAQQELVTALRIIIQAAPLFTPRMPRTGTPFSVRMTNCGPMGWVSDIAGYRYQATHPETATVWPPMPEALLDAWQGLSGFAHPAEACLVNWYEGKARMGLHQDRDEQEFTAPVLSVSLGDSCLFRYGGMKRQDPTQSVTLESGDVLLIGGASRLCFHGVDRVMAGSNDLLPRGGRINLTMRRVTGAK
ncbi:MAG: alpha-ketoglutarate-dependent dioxygenase AlkB family protein [Beijerinckiaceae bacterium]